VKTLTETPYAPHAYGLTFTTSPPGEPKCSQCGWPGTDEAAHLSAVGQVPHNARGGAR
jgi:hypothetical protein